MLIHGICQRTKILFNSKSTQPEELGAVQWNRDLDRAIEISKKEAKPILILFQEVPGCSTCRNYGNRALSHPLIVEAIETLFVPLAIFNNKKGEDARVLKYFKEPSWNNPVVRIINSEKQDITLRVSGDYSALGLVQAMLNALQLHNAIAPRYLELLKEELSAAAGKTETATVSMYCFWTGEKKLGILDGVVETQPGFMGGKEVVQVTYNPDLTSYNEIVAQAKNADCASHVFVEDSNQQESAAEIVGNPAISKKGQFRLDKEPKYYLSKTHYKYVPMTALQATQANSLIGNRKSPDSVLSARQIDLAKTIKKNTDAGWGNLINVSIEEGWQSVQSILKK